ncbi:DUF7169 domain-containing protein [Branchiibius cervicis]|uniref:DUF222 domain-containing protein n=1 Tax=Branchiibius cervicis TaxID=908252 RepID=A0ABW2AN76_9MICO
MTAVALATPPPEPSPVRLDRCRAEPVVAPARPVDVAALRGAARRVVLDAAALAALLHELDETQWTAGGTHSPATGYADPVGEVATDGRRLALRARMVEADRVLGDAARALVVARRKIEAVLD